MWSHMAVPTNWKVTCNVVSLYMITLVVLFSFSPNAVDVAITAMHPTK